MPRLNSQHTSKNTNGPLASEEFVVVNFTSQLMAIQRLQIGCLFKWKVNRQNMPSHDSCNLSTSPIGLLLN